MTTNTSSFKRNIKKVDDSSNHRSISGVKPWLNCNLGIVSSGNRELDELIGGGVPLGTITLFATDTISNYGQTFLSYFITEGISIGHSVLILTFDETNLEKFMSNLPYNQNLPSSSNRSKRQPNDEDDDAETASLNELKLAASYKKYIEAKMAEKKAREASITATSTFTGSGLAVQYCYSYDLSRSIQSELLAINPPCLFSSESAPTTSPSSTNSNTYGNQRLQHVLDSFLGSLQIFISDVQTRGAAGRICLPDLADLYLLCKHDTGTSSNSNSDIESSRILLRFILQVKHMVRTTRVAVWLGMSVSYTPSTTLQKMADLCDAYLIVETFVGKQDSIPYEFKDFCGFLYINKLSTLGSLCAFRPPGYKFGLKRDRRKVHVEPLHLPPEESRATASATESDASKMKLIAQSSTSSGAGTSDRVTVGTDSSGRTSSHVGAVSKTIGYEHSTPVTQQPSIQPSIHSTSEREQQSVSARTPAERAAAIAAKLATNAPKGSSISISSVHRKNATQKASENMSGSICSPSSGLNNTNGDLDF